jgi:RNA polymerase sigma-70 factor, ECF subfamily
MEITALYNRFHKLLYNYIALRVNNKQDVEDLLQDVFVKIFLNLRKLETGERLNGWIFSITRNAIIDYYRRSGSSRNKNSSLDDNLLEKLTPEEEIDTTKGVAEYLKEIIYQLPDEYRGIIYDSEINGIKQKELAVKYNIPYPTLRSKVQRGRSKLKVMLDRCCRIETDKRGNVLECTPRETDCDC